MKLLSRNARTRGPGTLSLRFSYRCGDASDGAAGIRRKAGLPARREKRCADAEPARYEFGIGICLGLKLGMWSFQTKASSQPLKRLVCCGPLRHWAEAAVLMRWVTMDEKFGSGALERRRVALQCETVNRPTSNIERGTLNFEP